MTDAPITSTQDFAKTSQALREFEDVIGAALDYLLVRIDDALSEPDPYFALEDVDEATKKARQAIHALLVEAAEEAGREANDAAEDCRWEIARAVKALRQALRAAP
jgi:hypothetical protein